VSACLCLCVRVRVSARTRRLRLPYFRHLCCALRRTRETRRDSRRDFYGVFACCSRARALASPQIQIQIDGHTEDHPPATKPRSSLLKRVPQAPSPKPIRRRQAWMFHSRVCMYDPGIIRRYVPSAKQGRGICSPYPGWVGPGYGEMRNVHTHTHIKITPK